MRDSAYCRAQALKCRELAVGIEDAGMVEHLILIAEEYEAEALRLESAGADGSVVEDLPQPKPEQT